MALMRCQYCGLLQDEPTGVKECRRCGGELAYEQALLSGQSDSYLTAQMELDQVRAPAGQNIDRYVLVTMRTPDQVPEKQAAPTYTGRAPLHLTTVLDVSGSMTGEKLSQAKEALRQAIHYLQDDDVFSLVTFSSVVQYVFEPTTITTAKRRMIESALSEIRAGDMTALCGGLEAGIDQARQERRDINLVILLSDGLANVGETDLEKIAQHAGEARKFGLTVSTIGVGQDYNEALMAEIASQGGGRFYHLVDGSQIPAYLTGELGEMANIAAREVNILLDLPNGAVIVPLSSIYPAEQSGQRVSVSVGNLTIGIELEVPLRLTAFAQPVGTRLAMEGMVTYISPAGNPLQTRLNRVTVRFVETGAFGLREGVIPPVVERVLLQMRAAQVLGVSKAMAQNPEEVVRVAHLNRERLYRYASLLGKEEAEKLVAEEDRDINAMMAAPSYARRRVSDMHAFMKQAKDFNKD